MDDDDDDPPPVSDAFALPSHLVQKPSEITTIPQIPRVTVRATTSDGKTIYLRKRKKPSPTVSRIIYREHSYGNLTRMSSQIQTASTHKMGNLLSVPIHRLMDGLSAATAENLQRKCV